MVIDTLIAVLDNAGISPAIGPVGLCIRLMHEIGSRYGATIIWLHHTTKNGSLTTGNDITRVTNSTTTWSCWTKPTPRDVRSPCSQPPSIAAKSAAPSMRTSARCTRTDCSKSFNLKTSGSHPPVWWRTLGTKVSAIKTSNSSFKVACKPRLDRNQQR